MPLGAHHVRFFWRTSKISVAEWANWIATIRKLMPMGQIKTDNERFYFSPLFLKGFRYDHDDN